MIICLVGLFKKRKQNRNEIKLLKNIQSKRKHDLRSTIHI